MGRIVIPRQLVTTVAHDRKIVHRFAVGLRVVLKSKPFTVGRGGLCPEVERLQAAFVQFSLI